MKTQSNTLVSVVMSAYNHALYVGAAIESVLSQTHNNIEFLITDDGSTDNTSEVISLYKDSRIKFSPSNKNRGACTATNELIAKARGQYVCIMNSDDIWLNTHKLEHQLTILNNDIRIGAVFGRANYIDSQGRVLDKYGESKGDIFNQENRSRGEWLEKFFMEGNCLCHPSIMIRKECYEQLGSYSIALRQLPDYEMWIRLLKIYEIYVSKEEIVSFRILPGENASSLSERNIDRLMNENYLINKSFFSGISEIDFITGFGRHFSKPGSSGADFMEVEKALLYFNEKSNLFFTNQIIGLELLYSAFQKPKLREILLNEYQIDDLWFHEKASRANLISENGKLTNQIKILQGEVKELEGRNQDIKSSLSWRISAPFRYLRDSILTV